MEELLSHYSNGYKKRLEDHLKEVSEKSKKIVLSKSLSLSFITQKELAEISYIIGFLHDFGKATTYFQLLNQLLLKNQLI